MKKIVKKRSAITIALFYCLFFVAVKGIISSKNKITVIDSHYTFTNFEYVRGFIYFKKGFSLTPTTTALLEVYYPIEGPINLNNGTLIINEDLWLGNSCLFYGSGYIKSNSYQLCLLNNNFTITSTLYFIDDAVINGKKVTRLIIDKDKGVLNFEKASNVTFSNMDLVINNALKNFVFPAAGLANFTIDNTHFFMTDTQTLTMQAATFFADGYSTIETVGLFKTNFLFKVSATSIVEIMPFAQLSVNDLFVGGVESSFIFNNQSKLYLNKAAPTSFSGNGVIKMNGKVFFYGNDSSYIVGMNANQGILLGSGARLILNNLYLKTFFS